MAVKMGVWFARRIAGQVVMLVMFVVSMRMLVFRGIMNMNMRVVLREVKNHSCGNQDRCHPEKRGGDFPQQKDG